jgi:hypothetical protein
VHLVQEDRNKEDSVQLVPEDTSKEDSVQMVPQDSEYEDSVQFVTEDSTPRSYRCDKLESSFNIFGLIFYTHFSIICPSMPLSLTGTSFQ